MSVEFRPIPLNGETWLICGGRGFEDDILFDNAMSNLIELYGCPSKVVQGGARGADLLAKEWAKRMALEHVEERAEWRKFYKRAGGMRNQRMLDVHHPHRVVAFPGNNGTADMVRRARKAGVEVTEIIGGNLNG